MTKLLASVALALVLPACADDSAAPDDFVGTWAYQTGQFEVDCGGSPMQFPADPSLEETFAIGSAFDLQKSDNAGCIGLTFELSDNTAALAPSPQSCSISGMGTSTATTYAITISADRATLTTAIEGTFAPASAAAADPCTLHGAGTLVRR